MAVAAAEGSSEAEIQGAEAVLVAIEAKNQRCIRQRAISVAKPVKYLLSQWGANRFTAKTVS